MIVSAAGYHGNTCAAIDISDYKFSGPGGEGQRDWVHVAPNPDTYRGPWKADDPDAGRNYAAAVGEITAGLAEQSRPLAGFISEPFPSVAGQIVSPPGYLKAVYDHVRAAGGLCIADEVQTGLGRLGRYQWGFEQQGAVPDMVVLGKPVGNGHPLAAVVTTWEIADSFANGMEYFSTFGGSTLSCVVGLEVLRILDDEDLPGNAEAVGTHILDGLREIAADVPAIGEVRGLGMFMGVEMIEPGGSHSPALANRVKNALRAQRILIGTDGPMDNVLKIRPPLCFSQSAASFATFEIAPHQIRSGLDGTDQVSNYLVEQKRWLAMLGLIRTTVTGIALFSMAILPARAADLVVGVPFWPVGEATAHIIKLAVEQELGMDIRLRERGTLGIFVGIDNGEIDVHPQVCLPDSKASSTNIRLITARCASA